MASANNEVAHRNPYHLDFVNAADVLFFSGDTNEDPRGFMAAQVADGKQIVVGTFGRQGAICHAQGGDWIEIPAIRVDPVVDTNGAGDTFFAGFLHGHLGGLDLAYAMVLGARVAPQCVRSRRLAHPALTAASVGG